MLVEIPQLSDFLKSLKSSFLDDAIDRFNYLVTTTLLLGCALLVATKQIVGSPIHCLISSEFPSGWVSYVHSYCFITGTYDQQHGEDVRRHGYYQWIPFILIAMAVLFYAPHFIWRIVQKSSHLDLRTVVGDSVKARALLGKERAEVIGKIVQYTRRVIKSGFDHTDPGNPNPFPQLTHCTFEVRDIAGIRPYNTDCVIMVNILNEKIFLLIWVWLHFVVVLTVLNLLYTIFVLFVPSARRRVIGNHLRIKCDKKARYYDNEVYGANKESVLLDEFANKAMSIDGVQLIRFISSHAGGLVAHEVIDGIWKDFKACQR